MARGFVIIDEGGILGGGQLFAVRLARWINEQPDGRAAIACPDPSPLATRCATEGIPILPLDFPDLSPASALSIPGGVWRVRKLLRRAAGNHDVIVANTPRAQAFAAVARIGLRTAPPTVNVMHEQETAARPTARAVLGRVGRVVAVGDNMATTYRSALGATDVRRLNNFIEPTRLHAAADRRARQEHRASPSIGVLARLIPEKGVFELVAELAEIPGAWSTLQIAGARQDTAYAGKVEHRIAELGLTKRVRLLGHVDDLDSFFDTIDILVIPSTGNEGQPTVTIEALAYGRPVAVREASWATDFAGLPVASYSTIDDLERVLEAHPEPAATSELLERFGPEQAVRVLLKAADASSPLR